MMIAQGETYPRRLRVQIQTIQTIQTEDRTLPVVAPKFVEVEEQTSVEVNHLPSDVARAVAHEEYPDTYNLWIGGKQKGYAAVQDLELSRKLRVATKEKKEILVKVEWNEEFKMYEILSQV